MGNRILVVDDNFAIRCLLQEFLSSEMFEVDLAENGEVAIRILDDNSNMYQCVITDIDMPVLDGISLGKYLFTHYPDTPVIAITAGAELTVFSKLIHPYFTSVIAKPFDLYDLLHTVREVCFKFW